MCSVGEDDFGDEGGLHSMPTQEFLKKELNGICKKCRENEVAVQMDFREPECENCFLAYVRHKFRAALGSSKILPRNADVLLIFDGSPQSIVLLDMLYFAQRQNTFKRLHCNVKVVYIDDSFLDTSPKQDTLSCILNTLSNYDVESYILSLSCNENITQLGDIHSRTMFIEDEIVFKKVLENIKSLTSKQDFILKTKYSKIKFAAENLKCPFVLLPAISTDLATTLLTNISLGRGSSTALDVSFLDERIEGIKIIRPLKDLNENEVKAYLTIRKLEASSRTIYGDNTGQNTSIQNLTKAFIRNLQDNFPSTVSTIFRTGDKLAPKQYGGSIDKMTNGMNECLEDSNLKSQKCSFCFSNLDCFESQTLFAIEFSRNISENANNCIKDFDVLEQKARSKQNALHDMKIRRLCYGCRNIYRDCSNSEIFK